MITAMTFKLFEGIHFNDSWLWRVFPVISVLFSLMTDASLTLIILKAAVK